MFIKKRLSLLYGSTTPSYAAGCSNTASLWFQLMWETYVGFAQVWPPVTSSIYTNKYFSEMSRYPNAMKLKITNSFCGKYPRSCLLLVCWGLFFFFWLFYEIFRPDQSLFCLSSAFWSFVGLKVSLVNQFERFAHDCEHQNNKIVSEFGEESII